MKKMTDVTPTRRGRPSKKLLVTPKSAPAAIGEASLLSPIGTKVSDGQASIAQTSTDKPNTSSNIKKRNGSRSVSTDPTGNTKKKRRPRSTDGTASPSSKKSAPSSRMSSKEKMETLLSKTIKQEALKVAKRLKSPSTSVSGTRKKQLEQAKSPKNKPGTKQFGRKKRPNSKSVEKLRNKLKDINTPEIRRLLTTDGFWSSKASSRSNSPLGQPLDSLSQKQTPGVKKDSRTSTPDISPSSARRQSLIKTRADKDDNGVLRSIIPISELRRLRTTEGFSFPDITIVTSRTGSREVSPSSCSSLDRGARQNAKSLSRSNENKSGVKTSDIDQIMSISDASGKAQMKTKNELDAVSDKLSEDQKIETTGTISINSSCSEKEAKIETPVSRIRKKKKNLSDQPTTVVEQKQLSSPVRHNKTLGKGFKKHERLKLLSVLSESGASGIDICSIIPTSTITPKVRKNARLTRYSRGEKVIKLKTGKAGKKKIKQKFPETGSSLSQETSGDLCTGDTNVTEIGEVISSTSSLSSLKSSTSPEFVLSDLLGSAELKRLNTTAGFWASTPDIGTVLGNSYLRRLRDVDSNSTKGNSDQLRLQEVEQTKQLAKFKKKTAVKPQSTLLQHRKKKLYALQNSLRKNKHSSNEESTDQNHSVDSLSTLATNSVVKKRRSKKLSKLHGDDQAKNLEDIYAFKEPDESVGSEIDSLQLLGSEIDPKNTIKSEIGTKYTLESVGMKSLSKIKLDSVEESTDHNHSVESLSVLPANRVVKKRRNKKLSKLHGDSQAKNLEDNSVLKEQIGSGVLETDAKETFKSEMDSKHSLGSSELEIDTKIILDSAGIESPKKIKHCFKEETTNQNHSVDSLSTLPANSVVKKRGNKKLSKLNKNNQVKNLEDVFTEPVGSVSSEMNTKSAGSEIKKTLESEMNAKHKLESPELEMNTKVTLDSTGLEVNPKDTLELLGSEVDANKLQGPEMNISFIETPRTQPVCVKTWKRGRRKVVPGEIRVASSTNISNIKTRGRKKVENNVVNKSLEILQNLESTREDDHSSTSHNKPKKRRNKTKLKRTKVLIGESNLTAAVSGSETDILPLKETEGSKIIDNGDAENESNTINLNKDVDSDNIEQISLVFKQDSGYKKDNLFESMGYDLLIPSEVSADPCAKLSSGVETEACPLNESVVNSQTVKSDLPILAETCDRNQHDDNVSKLEAMTSVITLSEPIENNIHSGKVDGAEMTASQGSGKDIPKQTDYNTEERNHTSLCIDSSTGLDQLKSCLLNESIAAVESIEQSREVSGTVNGSDVADKTVCKSDKFSVLIEEKSHTSAVLVEEKLDKLSVSVEEKLDKFSVFVEEKPDKFSVLVEEKPVTFSVLVEEKPDKFSVPVEEKSEKLSVLVNEKLDTFSVPVEETPDTFSVPVEEVKPSDSGVILKTNDSSLCELSNDDIPASSVEKTASVVDTDDANKSECNTSEGDHVMSIPIEKEQISDSGHSKLSPYNVQSDRERDTVDSETDMRNEITSLHLDKDIEIGQLSFAENLQKSPTSKNFVHKNEGEKSSLLESGDFKCGEQLEIFRTGAENVTTNKVCIDNDELNTGGENAIESSIKDTTEVSYDGDKLPPNTEQISAENGNLNQQNKRKKDVTKIHQQKLLKRTVISDVPSEISNVILESQTSTLVSDNPEGSLDVFVSEELHAVTKPNKEQSTKVKRRRRNAWKRGVLKKSVNLSRKPQRNKLPVAANVSEKSDMPTITAVSHIDCETTVSNSKLDENNESQVAVAYSPAVKKSLTNMLKKLQTNANLANAILEEKSFSGRFLRNIQPKQPRGRIRMPRLTVSSNSQSNIDTTQSVPADVMEELRIEIPGGSDSGKRKRGRPKKQRDNSLPKLTPLHMLPMLSPWNKTPPNLSPQVLTPLQPSTFIDTTEVAVQDSEFVCESVDDTDLHLYLSGVSDEEQSPKKDSSLASDALEYIDIPVYEQKTNNNVCDIQEPITETLLDSKEAPAAQKPEVGLGKEPRKPGRPKIKGRRGRPPGIPMTEEERRKKAQKSVLTQELYRDPDFEPLRASTQTPDVYTSDFTSKIDTPAAKFSLRQKSTRSPLEMLAMKRKQEEARYDLEQELRQARLIHLREKRSARESGDGLSDDGDGGQDPENLMLCSVVLSDFVKKLQLDDIELSSGGEVSPQAAEMLSIATESPEYNTFEDAVDEDWCADLEEHENDEWNDSRPYIPRLKLKRVIKKGTSSQNKRPKLKTQLERQQEPIKLVIKTEPEPNEAKVSSFVDSRKSDRSGFENSYMDFLRGQNESIDEIVGLHQRKSNILKDTQCETSTQDIAIDLSPAKILSLPITRTKELDNPFTGIDKVVSEGGKLPTSSSNIVLTSVSCTSNVDTTVLSVDSLQNMEHTGRTKRLSSVDEEDDDVLILDLDDGAVDHTSDDMFKDGLAPVTDSTPSAIQSQSFDLNITTSQENEIASRNDIAGDNALLRSTQRSHSNDEMGLMLESYNSQKEQYVQNSSEVEQTSATSFTSIEKSARRSENEKIAELDDISQSLNCVVKESACVIGSVLVDSRSEIQLSQSVTISPDSPNSTLESDKKNTTEVVDAGSAVMDVVTTDTSNVESHVHGDTTASMNNMVEEILVDTASMTSEDVTPSETSNLLHSESLAAASDKTVGECASDVHTLDNNNVSLGFKPQPKLSGPVKKPGLANDNSRSPKNSIYHGSGPEEWKVKVILHSDKFPSGRYSCKRCDFTTPTKLAIESHIYSHIPGVQFRCAYCESEFSSMAATSSHLKNTHSLSEAKLHISRHIDEKNFYDKEAAVFSEDSGRQSPAQAASTNTNAGGQSPPVIISVVVSGGVGAGRGGRPSAPPRRFVCTHCGFSTNVKEDSEHHVLDLHSTQALFACLLCSENVCYTESEIKDHSSTVHPARHHPYRKLPDFYDAEQLNLKEKAASQDDRENIFERMTSMFQDEPQTAIIAIDHRQKAKEYLYLQEGWREKTRVEADSTTAVDYTEEHDNTEAQSAPETPTPEESIEESSHQVDVAENEASDHHSSGSQIADNNATPELNLIETADAFITSSEELAIKISNVTSQAVDFDLSSSEVQSQQYVENQEETLSQLEPESHSALETAGEDHSQRNCYLSDHVIEDDGEGMGLKIIQVVSLSGQEEDMLHDQMPTDQSQPEQMDTDNSFESNSHFQNDADPSEHTTTTTKEAQKHTPACNEETVTQSKIKAQSSVEKIQTSSESNVAAAAESPTPDATASSISSPSFAGGLPLSYKCNACKVHTPYLLMMVKHLKAKHPNMRCFSCPYCKTTHSFVGQKQLRHHVKQSHPNKFGRNEIALSEDAKKFVEAMVLPMGPECIRVGNRIVLEEDIHTCTYCQVKIVSLASVYEHLNNKHSDLFEFVCPVCQSFKSKLLTEISDHCLNTHKSTLDTDKVHVSVPKNLFTALTCISKNGKYIEKSLSTGVVEKSSTSSTTVVSELSERKLTTSVPGKISQVSGSSPESQISSAVHPPLRLTSVASTPTVPSAATLVTDAQFNQPVFAIPLVSTGMGAVTTTRTGVAFSSSLFDTSTLTANPQLTTPSQSIPIIHNAAASSFLSPLPQQAHISSQHTQSSKQQLHLHPRPNERAHGSAKNLPVLNVPTIKPRAASLAAKSLAGGGRRSGDHSTSFGMPKNVLSSSSSIASILTASATNQQTIRQTGSSPCLDNLPDDEPNPDAFKIFNLRPTGHHTSSSSASPTVSPSVPSVYPPVSASMTSGYIQGAMAGFPPGMVISSNLLPLAFPFSQHQPLSQGIMTHKQNPRGSPLSRHLMPHPSSAPTSATPTQLARNSISQQEVAAATSVYLKKQQQQRELYLLKKQHQLLRHNQQLAVTRAYPAHQQPPSLSGQVYQPHPISYDHQQMLPGPSNMSHPSMFMSPVPGSSSSCMPSTSPQSSNPVKPTKGVHKRSSSLYQCPYCPILVTLRALEVASHIQQHHPGKQVAFRKIV